MIYLFHLVLFLFKEILVIVQLVVQIFDFFLLLFELSPYRIILGLGHTHRLLNHLEILYQLIILVIHLLDPILQIYLLIIDNFFDFEEAYFSTLRVARFGSAFHSIRLSTINADSYRPSRTTQ